MGTGDTGVHGEAEHGLGDRPERPDALGGRAAVDGESRGVPGARPESEPAKERTRGGRTLRRVLLSLGVLGLVLALAIGGGLWLVTSRWGGNIDRVGGVFG